VTQKLALRISNGIAILMLFISGYAFGRHAGRRPWLTGIAMVIIGSVLVGITIGAGG
jgi:VIT1/CCC1 family predicted Fe2+/Mn2+ transporter